MDGLMQNVPLTVDRIFDHAAAWHGAREVVSRDAEESPGRPMPQSTPMRSGYRTRWWPPGSSRATALRRWGWNGARHLAAWYGAAGIGAVLHTLNPRLFMEQIAYIANHAADRLLIADPAGGRSGRRIAGTGAVDLFLRSRCATANTLSGAGVRRLDRRGIPPNMTGAGSTKTAPAACATPAGRRAIPRACSIRACSTISTC